MTTTAAPSVKGKVPRRALYATARIVSYAPAAQGTWFDTETGWIDELHPSEGAARKRALELRKGGFLTACQTWEPMNRPS